MDMTIRTMATLLGTWLAKSRRSSVLLLSVLLCLGATSASAVTWDYEPGTGTFTGFTGSGSKTVTQVNTAAGETLRAVSVNDNMGGTVVSGSTPYAGSDSLFSSAYYNGETSVTFSLISGKQFDLTSIAFTEFFAISETITLTSSKGTASYFVSAGGSGTFNVAGDVNAAKMQGITSFTVSANPTYFAIGFDNIVLSNITSPASAPTATTSAASSISATGATLNGTVNDNGASTTVTFDYGTTTGYGTNVAGTTGGPVAAGSGSTAVSKTLAGLTCNTTYHYRVKGVNSAGTTNGSDASFTTSKCAQTITFNNPGAQNFGTTPTLTATSTSGLTVSFSSSTTGVCTITSGGALTFVTAGTCTINADQDGNSTYLTSSKVSRSFSVNAVVPSAPTICTATAGDIQASISFSAPASNVGASITGYTVTSSPGGLTGTGTSSPITVTGLTNGTAYTFTVTATNSAGTSSASAASNSVTPATVPGAPMIGTPVAGNAQVSVSFSAPASNGGSAITDYTVTSSPGGFTATGVSSPIVVTGLTNGTAYSFTVTATNAIGTGSPSGSTSSVPPATEPCAPTIGTATAGNAQATVSFSAPASNGGITITGYTVIPSPGGLTATGASSPITVTGLSNGTAYTFTVTATNNVGTGSASAASNSITPATLPGAPTIGAVTAGNTQVTVNFSAPASYGSAITGYTATSSPGGITATGASSPINVTGLTNGTAYSFTVTATNVMGTSSPSGSTSNVTPATVPGAPTIGSATAGNAQATVSFAAPASNGGITITGYTVTSSPGGITHSGASSPITVTGLSNGTAYTFSVTATNSVGRGSASAASNSVTPAALPGAPTIGSATAGDAQATVSFTAPASNGGGVITAYTVTSSPGGITGAGTASPITVTGLTNGTSYIFTVTATTSAGTGSASAASNSVTPKGTQAITFANPGAQNFGTTPILTATSDSGLTPTFSSSTTVVCTIASSSALTFLSAGSCTINADQAGNGSFLQEPQVSRTFTDNAVVPGAPTGLGATAGEAQATVRFPAPVFTGRTAITSYTDTAAPGGMTAIV